MEVKEKTGAKGERYYSVIFNGEEYRRYPKGKHPNYFYHKWKSEGHYYQKLLHHAVYEYYNGPIPKGKVIHHIDKNPTNNEISNLMAVTPSEHAKLHDEHIQAMQENRNPNAGFTKNNWHERRAVINRNLQNTIKVCEYCGKEFTPTNVHQRFCSKHCHHRWQYTSAENLVDAICMYCGKPFKHNKYLKQKCCSVWCAHQLSHKKHGFCATKV